jgi:hypothetical protein
MRLPRLILMTGLAMTLVACSSGRDVTLTRLKHKGEGPDEFSITPGLPLQEPESYAELPPPTPGQPNRTDQNPIADSVAALGGNINTVAREGVAPADGGLVRHATRFGVDGNIRPTLRREDEQVRRSFGRRNLLRIGPRDDYTQAYRRQWLDAYYETERLRRAGVITPTAPPEIE